MLKNKGWTGVAFPFRFVGGKIATSEARIGQPKMPHIDESIVQILGTNPGERPMAPEFGFPNREMVFGNFSSSLVSYYEDLIKECIERNDDRIIVGEVLFDNRHLVGDGVITIRVNWILKGSDIPYYTEYKYKR